MKSYAQNMEDILLKRVFQSKENGFYIDLGAHHPSVLSTTKIFYDDLSWHGINVEPLPKNFETFVTERPRDINLNVAISDCDGILPFYSIKGVTKAGLDGSALSSFSKAVAIDACSSLGLTYDEILVKTQTLASICETYIPADTKIDFLKIDAEGHEEKILKGADFIHFRPEVVILETPHPNANPFDHLDEDILSNAMIDNLMEDNSYISVYHDGLNKYYLANEAKERKKFFSLPVGIFDGVNLPQMFTRISTLTKKVSELEKHLIKKNISNEQKRKY